MTRRSQTSSLLLILAFVSLRSNAGVLNDPSLNDYDVAQYVLSLSFNLTKKSFQGSVVVNARALKPLSHFVLSASNQTLTIDSVLYNNTKTIYNHSDDHLVIELPTAIQAQSQFDVTLYYRGTSSFQGQYEGGGVLFSESNRIATISEPNFARMWWPCKDVPSDKATAAMTITVPESLTAVSNGALKDVQRHGGTATYYWETTYPIATYLISVVAASYREFSEFYEGPGGKRMKISYFVFPEDEDAAKIDFQNTTKILHFFASKFCEYPFIDEKFGFAEVEGALTMENQTICSIQQSMITGKGTYESTFVHEIAHHWWGNMITPVSWHHTWLNEGFATYAEALYREHIKGYDAYQSYIDRLMSAENGVYAGSVIGQSDTAFWDSFAPRVYAKGAIILHMLRGAVGDSVFFAIMRNYVNNQKYRYGNAETEDFIRECEKVYGQSLKWFFDQWVFAYTDSIDRPEYEYAWRAQQASSQYNLILDITQNTAAHLIYKMPLDIIVKSAHSTYSFTIVDSLATQTFFLPFPEKPEAVEIDKENKVFKVLKQKEGF
ncbi:MAG: M1 family metallopeptidase [Ignavibacteriae bacterium]|nr:M1 family metallopeptidase [Ignavibacteriota bacterium]